MRPRYPAKVHSALNCGFYAGHYRGLAQWHCEVGPQVTSEYMLSREHILWVY